MVFLRFAYLGFYPVGCGLLFRTRNVPSSLASKQGAEAAQRDWKRKMAGAN